MVKVKKIKKTSEAVLETASPVVTSKKVKRTPALTTVGANTQIKTLKAKKKENKFKTAENDIKSVVPEESIRKKNKTKKVRTKAKLSGAAKIYNISSSEESLTSEVCNIPEELTTIKKNKSKKVGTKAKLSGAAKICNIASSEETTNGKICNIPEESTTIKKNKSKKVGTKAKLSGAAKIYNIASSEESLTSEVCNIPEESTTIKKKKSKKVGREAELTDEAKTDVASPEKIVTSKKAEAVSSPQKRKRSKEYVGGKTDNTKKMRSENRVFIGNLNYHTSAEEVKEKMSVFGAVRDIFLPMNGENSKGFAFVEFLDKKSKCKALASDGPIFVGGRNLVIREPEQNYKSKEMKTDSGTTSRTNFQTDKQLENELFIRNIPKTADGSSLESHFSRYGKVAKVTLPTNRATDQHKGFAFVAFEDESSVNAALAEDHEIDDSRLFVKLSEGKKPLNVDNKPLKSQHDNQLHVGGIGYSMRTESFEKYFAKYGSITNVSVPWNYESSTNKGFAFVAFKTVASVEAALADDHMVNGRRWRLSMTRKNEDKTKAIKNKKVEESNRNLSMSEDEETEEEVEEEEADEDEEVEEVLGEESDDEEEGDDEEERESEEERDDEEEDDESGEEMEDE